MFGNGMQSGGAGASSGAPSAPPASSVLNGGSFSSAPVPSMFGGGDSNGPTQSMFNAPGQTQQPTPGFGLPPSGPSFGLNTQQSSSGFGLNQAPNMFPGNNAFPSSSSTQFGTSAPFFGQSFGHPQPTAFGQQAAGGFGVNQPVQNQLSFGGGNQVFGGAQPPQQSSTGFGFPTNNQFPQTTPTPPPQAMFGNTGGFPNQGQNFAPFGNNNQFAVGTTFPGQANSGSFSVGEGPPRSAGLRRVMRPAKRGLKS